MAATCCLCKFRSTIGLQRILKGGVWIVEVSSLARRSLTRLGQHLNGHGKDVLCAKILSKIKSLGREQDEPLDDAVAANQHQTQPSRMLNDAGEEHSLLNDKSEPTSVTLQFDSYADVVRSSSLRRLSRGEKQLLEPSLQVADDVESHTKRSAAGECQHGSVMTKFQPNTFFRSRKNNSNKCKIGPKCETLTYNLHGSVNSPTRVTATTATTIDNDVTNIPFVDISLMVMSDSNLDAQLVTFTECVPVILQPQTVTSRVTRPENISTLYALLKDCLDNFFGAYEMFGTLNKVLLYYMHIACPFRKISQKRNIKRNSWITPGILVSRPK
ncbi:hypothetical protein J6590_085453 [Homalodisca vitripennis]|nr:hypothetical protein J6590_085453 [Homalodisca vitripennis]